MTKTQCAKKPLIINKAQNIIVVLTFTTITVLLILNQDTVKSSLQSSIKMCLSSIIPSVFPFMILSDFLVENLRIDNKSLIPRIFSKCFSISESALTPFVLGNICGFPLGAKAAIDLYYKGAISRDECERLLGFANNPSLAFIISGVGMGMRKSITEGIVLYLVVVISSCIIGIVSKSKVTVPQKSSNISKQKYSIVNSIKNSASAVITVCSYIVFFSIIADIAVKYINSTILSALLASVLEIGTATHRISESAIPKMFNLSLTAFALGFSGLSVYLQTLSLVPVELNKIKCLLMKISQGILAFVITLVYSILIS